MLAPGNHGSRSYSYTTSYTRTESYTFEEAISKAIDGSLDPSLIYDQGTPQLKEVIDSFSHELYSKQFSELRTSKQRKVMKALLLEIEKGKEKNKEPATILDALIMAKDGVIETEKLYEVFPEELRKVLDDLGNIVAGENFLSATSDQRTKIIELVIESINNRRTDENKEIETEDDKNKKVQNFEKEQGSEFLEKNSEEILLDKRKQALVYYQSGDYLNAKNLLEELLLDNFDELSTRMHLARLALITDNFADVLLHANEAWRMKNEAKSYVLARIIWFKICLEFLNSKSRNTNKSIFRDLKLLFKKEMKADSNLMRQLKTILKKDDAFMGWAMQPILDHINPKITKTQHALLTALVAAMSDKQNLQKLNDFPEWRNAK